MKRMKAGKNDCTVYGACAREQVFECLKINNSGIVSILAGLEWQVFFLTKF